MILEMKGNTTHNSLHLSSVPFQHAANEIAFAYSSFYNFS